MTYKGQKLSEEFENKHQAYHVELCQVSSDIHCLIASEFSKEAVCTLIDKLEEDYKDIFADELKTYSQR